jgi:hypothetical protein
MSRRDGHWIFDPMLITSEVNPPIRSNGYRFAETAVTGDVTGFLRRRSGAS